MTQLEDILQGSVVLSLVAVDDVDDDLPLGFTLLADGQGGVLQEVGDEGFLGVGQEGRGDDGDVAREARRSVPGRVWRGEVRETVAREISRRLDWERILVLRLTGI